MKLDIEIDKRGLPCVAAGSKIFRRARPDELGQFTTSVVKGVSASLVVDLGNNWAMLVGVEKNLGKGKSGPTVNSSAVAGNLQATLGHGVRFHRQCSWHLDLSHCPGTRVRARWTSEICFHRDRLTTGHSSYDGR